LIFGAAAGGMAASAQLISCSYGVGSSVYFFTNAGTCHFGQAGALDVLTIDAAIHFNTASVHYQTGISSPALAQDDTSTNSATGQTLTIQAQNATGTTTTGGALALKSGTGTTVNGTVDVYSGTARLWQMYNNGGSSTFALDTARIGFSIATAATSQYIQLQATNTGSAIYLMLLLELICVMELKRKRLLLVWLVPLNSNISRSNRYSNDIWIY